MGSGSLSARSLSLRSIPGNGVSLLVHVVLFCYHTAAAFASSVSTSLLPMLPSGCPYSVCAAPVGNSFESSARARVPAVVQMLDSHFPDPKVQAAVVPSASGAHACVPGL